MASTAVFEFTDANFESEVLKSFKQSSEAESAIFLLDLLLQQSDNILKLPAQVRQGECTIQRFYLLLWPLLNIAESGNYDKAKE